MLGTSDVKTCKPGEFLTIKRNFGEIIRTKADSFQVSVVSVVCSMVSTSAVQYGTKTTRVLTEQVFLAIDACSVFL